MIYSITKQPNGLYCLYKAIAFPYCNSIKGVWAVKEYNLTLEEVQQETN